MKDDEYTKAQMIIYAAIALVAGLIGILIGVDYTVVLTAVEI